jgi:hypothetical protein
MNDSSCCLLTLFKQCMTEKMTMLPDADRAIWLPIVHKYQFVLHRLGRGESNIPGAKGFKDNGFK